MSAELVTMHEVGAHNSDLKGARARVLQGGSWKKQRVILVLPAADMIPAKVALSHWNLIFPPNNGVVRFLAQGMEVGHAYSTAMDQILADPNLSQWEYLLTIEHDNLVPPDGVTQLITRLEQNPWLSAVSGLYWCKGPGGCAHIWGQINDPIVNYRPQPPDPNGGLIECYGLSMGFSLYRLSMFKDPRFPRPFFKTKSSTQDGGVGTQDLAFWSEARKFGHRCAVDCSVKVGHLDYDGSFGPKGMVW